MKSFFLFLLLLQGCVTGGSSQQSTVEYRDASHQEAKSCYELFLQGFYLLGEKYIDFDVYLEEALKQKNYPYQKFVLENSYCYLHPTRQEFEIHQVNRAVQYYTAGSKVLSKVVENPKSKNYSLSIFTNSKENNGYLNAILSRKDWNSLPRLDKKMFSKYAKDPQFQNVFNQLVHKRQNIAGLLEAWNAAILTNEIYLQAQSLRKSQCKVVSEQAVCNIKSPRKGIQVVEGGQCVNLIKKTVCSQKKSRYHLGLVQLWLFFAEYFKYVNDHLKESPLVCNKTLVHLIKSQNDRSKALHKKIEKNLDRYVDNDQFVKLVKHLNRGMELDPSRCLGRHGEKSG